MKIKDPKDVEKALLAEAENVLNLVYILATGRDTFGEFENLDFPPNERLLKMWFNALVDLAKNASYRVPIKDRYDSTDTKKLVDEIVQDVVEGTISVKDGKDMLDFMSAKINAIELIHIKERIDQAGDNLQNMLNITLNPSKDGPTLN